MVWWCISHDCQLDFVTIQGNLTDAQYIQDVLEFVVSSHFDNHPLATRHVYMDDNTRPHRSRAVTTYLQTNALTTLSWSATSPDLNPLGPMWVIIGRRIQTMGPSVQNLRELEGVLDLEWL